MTPITRTSELLRVGMTPDDAIYYAEETSYTLAELIEWVHCGDYHCASFEAMDDIEADQYA